MKTLSAILARLWTNWITLLGSVITTVAALGILAIIGSDLLSPTDHDPYSNPYSAAFMLLVALPSLFILGLLLIPVGLAWEHRKGAQLGEAATAIMGVLQNRAVAGRIESRLSLRPRSSTWGCWGWPVSVR